MRTQGNKYSPIPTRLATRSLRELAHSGQQEAVPVLD
jgi:hypothetical protein